MHNKVRHRVYFTWILRERLEFGLGFFGVGPIKKIASLLYFVSISLFAFDQIVF